MNKGVFLVSLSPLERNGECFNWCHKEISSKCFDQQRINEWRHLCLSELIFIAVFQELGSLGFFCQLAYVMSNIGGP